MIFHKAESAHMPEHKLIGKSQLTAHLTAHGRIEQKTLGINCVRYRPYVPLLHPRPAINCLARLRRAGKTVVCPVF